MTMSSFGTDHAGKVAESVFDNTATIPQSVECKGDFTLVNRFTNSEQTCTDLDFSRINHIIPGVATHNKVLVLDENKNISGIESQTNYNIFTLSKIDNCDCDNLLFKRARGTLGNLVNPYDNNKIGSINFHPLVSTSPITYYNSSSIYSKIVGQKYTIDNNNYIGSEILFQTTGIGTDTYRDDRVKIDTYGNLNILNRKELRMYSKGINSFIGFRSSSSTVDKGYTMELPPDKGNTGDTLMVQSVGKNGKITLISNSTGKISSAEISDAGEGYDINYPPEINTRKGINGGIRKENGTVGSSPPSNTNTKIILQSDTESTYDRTESGIVGNVTTGPSVDIILSLHANSQDDYYNGWIIETTSPQYKRIITDYIGSSKTATTSSSMTSTTSSSTSYKLIWAPDGGTLSGEKILQNNASSEDDYYIGWTITVDVNGTISEGVITDYIGSSKSITVDFTPTVTTTNGTPYSLINKDTNYTDDYYNGWIIETINPSYKKIISDYESSSKTITTSSTMSIPTSTETTYKLTWAPLGGIMTGENILDNKASSEDDYYNGWTITVDVNGIISEGVITDYIGSSKTITVNFIPTVTTASGITYSLTNTNTVPASIKITSIGSSGEITGFNIIEEGIGYTPNTKTTVELSSQNKLQWTPSSTIGMDISSWGVVETVSGTCNNTTSSGSSTISVGSSLASIVDGYNMNCLIVTNNPIYIAHILSYNKTGGTLSIEGQFPSETNTSTTFKIYKYRAGGRTGNGNNIGSNTSTTRELDGTFNGQNGNPSNINDYYRGWAIMSIGSNGEGSNDWGDLYTGIITAYNGTTHVATVTMTSSNGGNLSTTNQAGYVLSDSRPYGTNINVGPGLGGGGNMALNDININLDLSTHDILTDSSGYTIDTANDKLLVLSNNSSTSKLPLITNFLSGISGSGITSDSIGLNIETTQNINKLLTDHLIIRGKTIMESESIYLNIGKDDTNNLNILPKYTNNELSSVVIKSDTSNSSDNAKVQFDIGDNDNILDIHNSGISVRSGIVKELTIANGGSGYSTAPVLTLETSPMGSSYTATATCTISSGSINSVTITYAGEGYITAPTINLSQVLDEASITATLSVRTITGEIGTTTTKFPGSFTSIISDGNITVGGTVTGGLTLESSDTLTIPGTNNILFTTNQTSFILGYGTPSSMTDGYQTILGPLSGNQLETGAEYNTYLGYKAGYNNQTKDHNTFIGAQAGRDAISSQGTMIGYLAGEYLTTGGRNTILGANAGSSVSGGGTASANTIIGESAGNFITSGSYNVYLGNYSGRHGTSTENNGTGNYNIMIGYRSGELNHESGNISIGYHSGRLAKDNTGNTFIGYYSGEKTISNFNTFIGYESGLNTTKPTSGNIGNNTFIGYLSGKTNTTGQDNTFIGKSSGLANESGVRNVFLGSSTGESNITGGSNVLIGYLAGKSNTSGWANVCIGQSAGWANQSGGDNVIIGYDAGYYNTSTSNTFIGKGAGKSNTSGAYNTYIGDRAGESVTNVTYSNVCIGRHSGSNQIGGSLGSNNSFLGTLSGRDSSGNFNTYLGCQAGIYRGVGDNNTAVGYQSGKNGSGDENTFIGYRSGNSTTANESTFIGAWSGYSNTSGEYNTYLGYKSGYTSSTVQNSTIIGYKAGYYNTGNNNTFIGKEAGFNNTTGSGNIMIGSSSGKSNTDGSNNILIGYENGITGSWSNCIMIGNESGQNLNSTATDNIFIGQSSGKANTSGQKNTFMGISTGKGNTTGIENTFIGTRSGENNTTASYNTLMGYLAGDQIRTGHSNTIIGRCAGRNTWTGNKNTYLGKESGFYITGSDNICIGSDSGPESGSGAVSSKLYIDNSRNGSGSLIYGDMSTTARSITINGSLTVTDGITGAIGGGSDNTATFDSIYVNRIYINSLYSDGSSNNNSSYGTTRFGYLAMPNTSMYSSWWTYNSYRNTVVGAYAGYSNYSGDENSLFGFQAGYSLSYGGQNTCIGCYSGYKTTSSTSNVYIGHKSGYNLNGSRNTVIGSEALYSATSWSMTDNVIIGHRAGYQLLYGKQSVCIGYKSAGACVGPSTGTGFVAVGAYWGYWYVAR